MRRRLPLLCVTLMAVAAVDSAAADRLAVIVHADRDTTLELDALTQIYLKQRRFWSEGDPIVPINREAQSPLRRWFSRLVLGADARKLDVYWNRRYFQGVLPPATLASDEAVRRFVASDRRAIGYVSAEAVDDSVRVLLYLDPP